MQSSHVTISSIVKDQIGHMLKDYSSYPIRGVVPMNFIKFEEFEFDVKKLHGKKIGLLVKAKNLRTFNQKDKKERYNRLVKVTNAIKFINETEQDGSLRGFDYDYVGTLIGTLKYDYENNEWYIFINQGQHRAAMSYLVGGDDIYLPVIVDVPALGLSEKEEIILESKVHYVDATKRTGQAQPDKIRSAYFCKEKDAIDLVNFFDECSVNVGDLLNYERSCDSWGDIDRSIKTYGEENTRRALSAIGKFSKETKINAKAVVGLSALAFHFEQRVKYFEDINCEDFFETICKYVFVDRKPKVISMSDITKYSGNIKTPYLPMSMWVRYVNEMFEWEDFKKENKSNLWMSRRSKEWQDFLINYVEDIFHETFNQKIEPN